MNELGDVEPDPDPRDAVLARHVRPRRACMSGQLIKISFLQESDHRRQVIGYPVPKLGQLDAVRPGDVPADLLEPASLDLGVCASMSRPRRRERSASINPT